MSCPICMSGRWNACFWGMQSLEVCQCMVKWEVRHKSLPTSSTNRSTFHQWKNAVKIQAFKKKKSKQHLYTSMMEQTPYEHKTADHPPIRHSYVGFKFSIALLKNWVVFPKSDMLLMNPLTNHGYLSILVILCDTSIFFLVDISALLLCNLYAPNLLYIRYIKTIFIMANKNKHMQQWWQI